MKMLQKICTLILQHSFDQSIIFPLFLFFIFFPSVALKLSKLCFDNSEFVNNGLPFWCAC